MQTQDIQAALEQMVRDLTDLGAVCPEASFSVNCAARHTIYLRVDLSTEWLFNGSNFKFLFADTPEEALSAAREYIAALPDPRTAKRRQWQKKLGDVIDEGYELELPGDVMAPLHAGSLAMTENLLEDQS